MPTCGPGVRRGTRIAHRLLAEAQGHHDLVCGGLDVTARKGGEPRPSRGGRRSPSRPFQAEVRRQQRVMRKVEAAEQRLLFVVTVLMRILADERFRTLMRAVNVVDVPRRLADRLSRGATA